MKHQHKTILQNLIQKPQQLFWAMFLWLMPLLVYADDGGLTNVAKTEVKGQSTVNTIWIVGDTEVISTAFRAAAMIFKTNTFNSAMMFACLLAIGAMAISMITQRNMQVYNYVVFLILSLCLFLPKTTVYVASYYGQDMDGNSTGGTIGATKSVTVDGVPVGIAWPLGIASNAAKSFTELFDVGMQPADATNSYLIQGAEGYFSPLKTTLRMREAWNVPEIAANLATFGNQCSPNNTQEIMEYGGVGAALNIMAHKNNPIKLRMEINANIPFEYYDEDKKRKEATNVNCSIAGTLIWYQMLAQVTPNQKGYSKVAERLAKTRSLNAMMLGTKGDGKFDYDTNAKAIQQDIDHVSNRLGKTVGFTNSANRLLQDPYQAMMQIIRYVKDNKLEDNYAATKSVQEAMQGILIADTVTAAEIQANIVFGGFVSNCLRTNDRVCTRGELLMNEGLSRARIDNAGTASMFQHFLHHTMNVLVYVYIIMSPIMIVVIVAMGLKGWKLITSYTLLAVWISSWLPLSVGITNYMLSGYEATLDAMMQALVSNNIGSDFENKRQILNPIFLNNILNGASDMVASASSMLSMVPTIMFALLSGSAYGFVQIAQRAGMTGKDYIDENKVVPDLETHEAIGAMQRIANYANNRPNMTVDSNSLAFMQPHSAQTSTQKIHLEEASSEVDSLTDQLKMQQQMTDSYSKLNESSFASMVSNMGSMGKSYTDGTSSGDTAQNTQAAQDSRGISNNGSVDTSLSAYVHGYLHQKIGTPFGGILGNEVSGNLDVGAKGELKGSQNWTSNDQKQITETGTTGQQAADQRAFNEMYSRLTAGGTVDMSRFAETRNQLIQESKAKEEAISHQLSIARTATTGFDIDSNTFDRAVDNQYDAQMRGFARLENLDDKQLSGAERILVHNLLSEFKYTHGNEGKVPSTMIDLYLNPETRRIAGEFMMGYFQADQVGNGYKNIESGLRNALNRLDGFNTEQANKEDKWKNKAISAQNVPSELGGKGFAHGVGSGGGTRSKANAILNEADRNINNGEWRTKFDKSVQKNKAQAHQDANRRDTQKTAAEVAIQDISNNDWSKMETLPGGNNGNLFRLPKDKK